MARAFQEGSAGSEGAGGEGKREGASEIGEDQARGTAVTRKG